MTADQVGPLQGHTVTVVVKCGFIGCDWSMEIGTAPLEVHNAYLEHLDVHDPDHVADCDCVENAQALNLLAQHDPSIAAAAAYPGCPSDGHETEAEALDCPVCCQQMGLYANDTPEQTIAEQASFDRFMAGGEDQ